MISASQSIGLAIRLTKGWVSSSKVATAEMVRKRSKVWIKDREFLNERRKRNVITPYATMCLYISLTSIAFSCSDNTSCGRCVRRMIIAVKVTATTSHLRLKNFSVSIMFTGNSQFQIRLQS